MSPDTVGYLGYNMGCCAESVNTYIHGMGAIIL